MRGPFLLGSLLDRSHRGDREANLDPPSVVAPRELAAGRSNERTGKLDRDVFANLLRVDAVAIVVNPDLGATTTGTNDLDLGRATVERRSENRSDGALDAIAVAPGISCGASDAHALRFSQINENVDDENIDVDLLGRGPQIALVCSQKVVESSKSIGIEPVDIDVFAQIVELVGDKGSPSGAFLAVEDIVGFDLGHHSWSTTDLTEDEHADRGDHEGHKEAANRSESSKGFIRPIHLIEAIGLDRVKPTLCSIDRRKKLVVDRCLGVSKLLGLGHRKEFAADGDHLGDIIILNLGGQCSKTLERVAGALDVGCRRATLKRSQNNDARNLGFCRIELAQRAVYKVKLGRFAGHSTGCVDQRENCDQQADQRQSA